MANGMQIVMTVATFHCKLWNAQNVAACAKHDTVYGF